MARRHRLALALVVVLAISTVSNAAPVCPRGLAAAINSDACSAHRLGMLTGATRVAIDAGDNCGDSLRVLFPVAAAVMPCTANVASPTNMLDTGHALRSRRLESSTYVIGKFKCRFDTAAPLNVTDLSQGFIVDCEQILEPGSYIWLWIMLGCIGGIVALGCLAACVPCCIKKTKPCLERRRERRRQQAVAQAKAEALYTSA